MFGALLFIQFFFLALTAACAVAMLPEFSEPCPYYQDQFPRIRTIVAYVAISIAAALNGLREAWVDNWMLEESAGRSLWAHAFGASLSALQIFLAIAFLWHAASVLNGFFSGDYQYGREDLRALHPVGLGACAVAAALQCVKVYAGVQ